MEKKFNKDWPILKQLRWYLERQPRAKRVPGYFKDGELIRGHFYSPVLGNQVVNASLGEKGHSDGFWWCYADAVKAAKRFQDTTREYLTLVDSGQIAPPEKWGDVSLNAPRIKTATA